MIIQMVALLIAALKPAEPLDLGDTLYLTHDTIYAMGYAETEKGEFYVGMDFSAAESYCTKTAPATEVLFGGRTIKFSPSEALSSGPLSSCTYVLGRDFFLAHNVDLDRTYHSISIGDEEFGEATGSFSLKPNKSGYDVEMKGAVDLTGTLQLGALRKQVRLEEVPSEWKTSPNVARFALTSTKWPVWYETGGSDRFGLGAIPGNFIRIELAKNRIVYQNAENLDLELILGEYVGSGEVFRIEDDEIFYFRTPEEGEPANDDEYPDDKVISIGGTSAEEILRSLQSNPFGTIAKLRKATTLVWKTKQGTQKTLALDTDQDDPLPTIMNVRPNRTVVNRLHSLHQLGR